MTLDTMTSDANIDINLEAVKIEVTQDLHFQQILAYLQDDFSLHPTYILQDGLLQHKKLTCPGCVLDSFIGHPSALLRQPLEVFVP